MPRLGGHATANPTAVAPQRTDDPAPSGEDNSPSPQSDSAKRPGDSMMVDAPPTRRERTASQTETDVAQDTADFRDRLRTAPYYHATATEPAPYVSTPENTENAFRNPMVGRPACEVMFPIGNPVLPLRELLYALYLL